MLRVAPSTDSLEHQALIAKYRSDPSTYSPAEFRQNLASWGPTLFYHLNEEVESLKPDVLRRCASLFSFCNLAAVETDRCRWERADWTLEEVKRLPM